MRRILPFLLLAACAGPPEVVVEPTRDGHFFDRPFPSDELLTDDGTIDLSDFPTPAAPLGETLVGGWARMAGESVRGFSHLGPAFLRLSEPVAVEEHYDGLPTDDVRLRSLDSEHRVPVRVRFVEDPSGDPFLAPNTLIVAPDPRHPLRSGERYALILDRRFAVAPEDYALPYGLDDERRVGFAVDFTVQDSHGELVALRQATDALLDANPDWLDPSDWREVSRITYAAAQTASGRDATRLTVAYADGAEEHTWLTDYDGLDTHVVELSDDPMRVFEGRIRTVAWRPLADLPYATPGLGFLSDFERSDGRIRFGADGTLLSAGEPEWMRVVVQVPRGRPATALFTWDHGTGGQAWSAVQHPQLARRNGRIRTAAAEAGVAILSRDQPLYGQRYPLIEEGFNASLGFYNIANLPAFRDNQRQGAVDHRVLHRFATEVLPTLDLDVDPARVGAFGHSLGSVTAHIALAMAEGDGADTAFLSGSGGFLANYVVATGLLGSDNDVVSLLEGFVEADLPPDPTGGEAVGALVGIPESGWSRVDDLHPVFALFQLIMDASDPLALAPHQPVPEHILMGVGDRQVPNTTTAWLAATLPDATLSECHALGDYDPHHCTFIEDEELDALVAWIRGLPD